MLTEEQACALLEEQQRILLAEFGPEPGPAALVVFLVFLGRIMNVRRANSQH